MVIILYQDLCANSVQVRKQKKDYISVIPLFKMGGRAVSNRRPPEPQLGGSIPKPLIIKINTIIYRG